MNSFRLLFKGSVGDSEQSPPGFLAAGLDQADYVELFAPKPWMITSTEQDFFTPAGAKLVYDEAKRWYSLYDAPDKIAWIVGPGGHGTPREVREAVYGWMIRGSTPASSPQRKRTSNSCPITSSGLRPAGRSPPIFAVAICTRSSATTQASRLAIFLLDTATDAAPASCQDPSRCRGRRELHHRRWAGDVGHAPDAVDRQQHACGRSRARSDELDVPDEARNAMQSGQAAMMMAAAWIARSRNGRLSGDWLANTRASLIGENLPAFGAPMTSGLLSTCSGRSMPSMGLMCARRRTASRASGCLWLPRSTSESPR